MPTRVALIAVIVERPESVEELNGLLHEHAPYIVGRMGLPYPKRAVSIISVAVDAPQDVISALAGRLGSIEGVSAKTAYSKLFSEE